MNKINNGFIKKKFMGKVVGLVIGILLALLGVFCFVSGSSSDNSAEANSIPFADAYNDDKLKDDIMVYIDTTEEPGGIGSYDEDEEYYFVTDGQDLYIIRCKESDYDRIVSEVNSTGKSHIEGTITELNDEVIDLAIEVYNDAQDSDEYKINRLEFNQYFQGVGLYVGGSTSAAGGSYAIGVILCIIALFMIILNGLQVFNFKKFFGKLTDADAETLSRELEDPQTIFVKGAEVFLTPNNIFYVGLKPVMIPYSDVVWAYKFEQTYNFIPVHTHINVFNREHKEIHIADMSINVFKKQAKIDQIFGEMYKHNPEIQFGYTPELIAQFKNK